MLVIDRGKADFLPARAGRIAGCIEGADLAGLRKADQRQGFLDGGAPALLDQLHEHVDGGAGRGERLRHRFGRGPARAAVWGDALGLVEGGGVEPGLSGEAGRGEPCNGGEAVEGRPDLRVGQHRKGRSGWREFYPTLGIIAFQRPATLDVRSPCMQLKRVGLVWPATASVNNPMPALSLIAGSGLTEKARLTGRDYGDVRWPRPDQGNVPTTIYKIGDS